MSEVTPAIEAEVEKDIWGEFNVSPLSSNKFFVIEHIEPDGSIDFVRTIPYYMMIQFAYDMLKEASLAKLRLVEESF